MKKTLISLLGLLLIGFAPTAFAALSFKQTNSTGNTGVTSILVTMTTTTTQGDLIAIFEENGDSGDSNNTPTDSAGNTYVLAASSTPAGLTAHTNIYYAANANAMATSTCFFSSAAATNQACVVSEFSGAALTNVLDATSTGGSSTSATNATSSVYTTANANDVLFFAIRTGNTVTTYTPATSFTIPANSTSTREAVEYQIVSTIQTATTTTMGFSASVTNSNVFAAFKAAAAPTTGLTHIIRGDGRTRNDTNR